MAASITRERLQCFSRSLVFFGSGLRAWNMKSSERRKGGLRCVFRLNAPHVSRVASDFRAVQPHYTCYNLTMKILNVPLPLKCFSAATFGGDKRDIEAPLLLPRNSEKFNARRHSVGTSCENPATVHTTKRRSYKFPIKFRIRAPMNTNS